MKFINPGHIKLGPGYYQQNDPPIIHNTNFGDSPSRNPLDQMPRAKTSKGGSRIIENAEAKSFAYWNYIGHSNGIK